jgi:hypothetical protein
VTHGPHRLCGDRGSFRFGADFRADTRAFSAAKQTSQRSRAGIRGSTRPARSNVLRPGRPCFGQPPRAASLQKQSRALVAGRNMTLQFTSCVSTRPAHLAFLQHPGYRILYFPAHPCFSALQLPRFLLHLRAAAFPRLPGCRSVTKTDSYAVGLICRPCRLSPAGVVRMAPSLPLPPPDPSLATEAPHAAVTRERSRLNPNLQEQLPKPCKQPHSPGSPLHCDSIVKLS